MRKNLKNDLKELYCSEKNSIICLKLTLQEIPHNSFWGVLKGDL